MDGAKARLIILRCRPFITFFNPRFAVVGESDRQNYDFASRNDFAPRIAGGNAALSTRRTLLIIDETPERWYGRRGDTDCLSLDRLRPKAEVCVLR
jgi:hypothetical protein